MFRDAPIADVFIKPLSCHHDQRGWLAEVFRQDEVEEFLWPAMAYVSVTLPGVARGPHAHHDQTDYFCFLGPSSFRLYLWDDRPQSGTYGCRQVLVVGEEAPAAVIVPPGVVHAYKNVGGRPGVVINLPNRLYRGRGRREPVDEIRHEDDPHSPFRLEEPLDAARKAAP